MALSDFTMVSDNIITHSLCERLLDIQNANKSDVFNLSENRQYLSEHIELTQYTLMAYDMYKRKLTQSYAKYLPESKNTSVEPFEIKHYKKNIGFCDERIDTGGKRMLSIIFYLNGVEFGGETDFPYLKYGVIPKACRCLIFPATWQYPYKSNIPYSNDKYIIQGYLNDIRD